MTTVLNLDTFAEGTRYLSPAKASAMAEAAVVCLQHQGHHPGVHLDGEDVQLLWSSLDSRAEMSHQDLQEATEDGATAVAILWVQARTGLQVVRRARKGPGFDWHLGPDAGGPPFAGTHCLEVSGILDDAPPLLTKRLREKLAQIRRGGTGIPGYAVVVGFRTPAACIGATP